MRHSRDGFWRVLHLLIILALVTALLPPGPASGHGLARFPASSSAPGCSMPKGGSAQPPGQRDKAWGEDRFTSGTMPTAYRFTGQRWDTWSGTVGLYFYNARYYDASLGRFVQPDTIVPNAGDPQALNRYSYVNNNPLRYVDPTGHVPWIAAGALVGAIVGAAAVVVPQVIRNVQANQPLTANIDPGQVASAAVTGAFVGAMLTAAAPLLVAQAGNVAMGVGLATNSASVFSLGMSAMELGGVLGAAIYGSQGVTQSASEVQSLAAANKGNVFHYDGLNGGVGRGGPAQLADRYPETRFQFATRGSSGPDVHVPAGTRHPSTYPGSSWPQGFDFGDFKPNTPSGVRAFYQGINAGIYPPDTIPLPYDPTTQMLVDDYFFGW